MLRALAISFLLAAGCDDEHCAEAMSETDSAPVIETFELIGQLDNDPWTRIFATSFSDGNGDVGDGLAEFHLNGVKSGSSLELFEVFRSSGVPSGARSGRIAFPLRFSDTVQDGDEAWLGLQLLDASEQRSNCSALRLHFDVR
jgi:hypothetical protein